MGTIYQTACPVCRYQTQLHLEGGLNSINLKRSISILEENEKEKINEMIERNEVAGFHIENQIGICDRCRSLKDNTIIEVWDTTGKNYLFHNFCEECGSIMKLEKYTPDIQVDCPRCGKAVMEFVPIGLWD